MEAKRFDEFHKYGCHFYGKLVVVDYTKETTAIPCTPLNFGRGNPELDKARKMVHDKGYKVIEVLLDIPEYVVRIE
jgi:hypothetical protein